MFCYSTEKYVTGQGMLSLTYFENSYPSKQNKKHAITRLSCFGYVSSSACNHTFM